MSAPGKYIPPALRRKLAEEALGAGAAAAVAVPVRRGVQFPSDRHGNTAANERHHRYRTNGANKSPTRAERAKKVSQKLARRTVKARAQRKSTLKGPRKARRQTRSASPTRKGKATTRAKSR